VQLSDARNLRCRLPQEPNIRQILDTARLAPSASSKQPSHFIIVEEKVKRVQIAKGARVKLLVCHSLVPLYARYFIEAIPAVESL
jgi:nitroreductase